MRPLPKWTKAWLAAECRREKEFHDDVYNGEGAKDKMGRSSKTPKH